MPIAIARLRQAAEQLRDSNQHVTSENLRRLSGASQSDIASAFLIKGLKEELGLLSRQDAAYMQYKAAAARLIEKGIPVSTAVLAREMGYKRNAVQRWFERNEERKLEFGLVSEGEASRIKRTAAYKEAADHLRRQKLRVTQTAIAQYVSRDRVLVCKDFNRDPTLKQLLLETTEVTESA